MKICTKCGTGKDPIEGFHANKGTYDGRHSNCKECQGVAAKAWKLANPERVKATKAAWVKANVERNKARWARWAKENPERKRANLLKWHEDHPEAMKVKNARRRALRMACKGQHYTGADVKRLFIEQGSLCAYCDSVLEAYHVDHIVPLSKGGSNGPENICLACPACNLSKHNKLIGVEWTPRAS